MVPTLAGYLWKVQDGTARERCLSVLILCTFVASFRQLNYQTCISLTKVGYVVIKLRFQIPGCYWLKRYGEFKYDQNSQPIKDSEPMLTR